ncbi:HIT-like protein [Hymenopellis radicata]|nr:HIT-like protein [Hymenopellis radicata]
MPNCFTFWPFSRRPAVRLTDDFEANSTAYVKHCPFCHVSKENGFNIIYEDEKFVAFRDRSPSSRHHIQVIPKTHVGSVKDLNSSDVELVKAMANLGDTILEQLDVHPEARKMGFHIPPFNSIHHLHLHLQGLPYVSRLRACKYPVAHGSGKHTKGFSWFVTPEQTIKILMSGNHVRVLPC